MRFSGNLAILFFLVGSPVSAQALTVSSSGINWTTPTTSNVSGGVLAGQGNLNATGNLEATNLWRNLSGTNATRPYTWLGNGSVTYSFGRLMKSLSFAWGSPDTYNQVSLYRHGTLLATLVPQSSPTGFTNTSALNWGDNYLVITASGLADAFDKVVFSSTGNHFEFGAVNVSPVPVPPAVMLLGTALMGFGGLGFRRRAAIA